MKLRDVTYIEEHQHALEVLRCYNDVVAASMLGENELLYEWIRIRFTQSGPQMIEGLLVSSMGLTR